MISVLFLVSLPGSGEVSTPSSPELKKTSKVSWSEMSISSIWSSKSTFTSMDEMLPIGAAGQGKQGNDVHLFVSVHSCWIISATSPTHVSCSLGYKGVPRTGRRPRRAGTPLRRNAASLSTSAAVPRPHLGAFGCARPPLVIITGGVRVRYQHR